MKSMLTVATLAVLAAAGPVYADCTAPTDDVTIPNGSTATRDQMIAAQKAVKALDTAVKQYSDCLSQEQSAKVAAGGDKDALNKQYATLQNAQVDKLQQAADKFNTELKAFKAKNAG